MVSTCRGLGTSDTYKAISSVEICIAVPKEADDSLPSGATVILYLHGNAETISQHHRRELYKIFQRSGFHVLAVDYRGYGESSGVYPISETTLASDAQVGHLNSRPIL